MQEIGVVLAALFVQLGRSCQYRTVTTAGGYTVNFGYAVIQRAAQDISVNSEFSSAIRRVLRSKVPLKVGAFVWKLFHDRWRIA
jgi:hypothetical protein